MSAIQPEYSFYLKTADGLRGSMLEDIVSFSATIRWNQVTKWTFTGAGLKPCPLAKGSEIIVYRGSEVLLSGFVTKIEDSYSASSGIYDWTVEGEDDLGRLAHRVIYPDPSKAFTAQADAEYSATGPVSDVVLSLISTNLSGSAGQSDRRNTLLTVQPSTHIGDEVTIAAKYDQLSKLILDEIKDGTVGLRSVWDGATGKSEIQMYAPRDVSQRVVFSVEAGSLAKWKRTRTAPKGNVIHAMGCEITNSQGEGTGSFQRVTVTDSDSVAEWGRVELYVSHSDISPIQETDDQGNVLSVEPWSSVLERLRAAAYQDLEENSAQDGYDLTPVIFDRFAYRDDWDIGDTVSVRIADAEFLAPVKEIKVKYAKGVEEVTPSVGKLEKGELSSVFDELGRLKSSIVVLQKGKK